MDLLLFSVNDAAAPQLLHVFTGGTNFGFLLCMKTYILVVANPRFSDSCLVAWLSSLTDCRSNWTTGTSLSTGQNVCIAAELLPDCAQVRDPMVLGRNLKSSGLQLRSLSRQLQRWTHFQIPSPAAFHCHLCANIGQEDCWIGKCSSAWGTSVPVLAVYPSPTLISAARLKRLRCRLFWRVVTSCSRDKEAELLVMS